MKHFTANACIANWKEKISHLFPAMYWSWKSRPKCFACWNTFSPFWALSAPCHLIIDLWRIPWLSIPGRFSTSYDSSTSHTTLLEIVSCTDWLVGCLHKRSSINGLKNLPRGNIPGLWWVLFRLRARTSTLKFTELWKSEGGTWDRQILLNPYNTVLIVCKIMQLTYFSFSYDSLETWIFKSGLWFAYENIFVSPAIKMKHGSYFITYLW